MQEDLFIISKVDLVPDKTFILEDIKVTVLYFVFYFYCKMFQGCDIIWCLCTFQNVYYKC